MADDGLDRRVLKTALFYQTQFLALALKSLGDRDKKMDGVIKIAYLHLLDVQTSLKNISNIIGRLN